MEDELVRARRALDSVSGELDLTWDDVLTRARTGQEFAPVLPLGAPRPPRVPRTRRMVAQVGLAAALMIVAVVTGSQVLGGRGTSAPPAGQSAATTQPVDRHAGSSSDSARATVDRVRDALTTTPWCVAQLQAKDPQLLLTLDKLLEPTRLSSSQGTWSSYDDLKRVTVDSTNETTRSLAPPTDPLANRPDLRAAVSALQLLVADGGRWRVSDATPGAISIDVEGVAVVVTVDAETALPTQVATDRPAGTFDVTWLSCAG